MHAERPSLLRALRFGDSADRLFVLGPFLALGLVLVLLWGLVGWFTLRFPEDLIADEQHELQASASILSREAEAVLRDAENALRSLDLLLLTRGEGTATDDASLALLSDSLRDASRGLVDLMLGTPNGSLYRIPSRGHAPFANIGAHPFVDELHRPGAARLIVGAPLQLRPQGRSVLPVAMRLSAPQGEFSMALALIDPETLAHQQQLRLRSDTEAFALLREDGLALLRTPDGGNFVGRNQFAQHPQRRQLFEGKSGHFVEEQGPVDGRARIVAFQSLQHFPIKLIASQSLEQVLGSHLRQRRAVLWFSASVSVAALAITLWLVRMQRRQHLLDAERRATADASPLGLFRCDLHGRVVYANDTYLRMHGLRPEQKDWGWLQLIEAEKRAETQRQWVQRIAAGEAIRVVRRLRLPDGQSRLVSVLTNPIRLNGRLIAQAGTIEDITARADEQKAIRTLNAIFELTPDYVCQIDLEGHLLYLNPAGRRRLGLAPDAPIQGFNFRQFFAADGEQRFRDIVLPAAARDGHWQGRAELIDGQGQSVPVECTALLHRSPRGRIEAISAIMRDVTAQLRAQRELRRNAAVLGAIAHTSQAMISVLDMDQQLIFCNRAFEERFGFAERSWKGLHVSQVLGSKTYERNKPLIERGLRGEEAEIDQRVGDREAPSFLRLHYAPLRSDGGRIEGLICMVTDVSEHKREELRLRKASQSDALTQLLNRAGFMAQAQEALCEAAAKQQALALLYLDLDRFKPVNDQYGHPTGDALLQAVARRLRHALRPDDIIARLGGDEFTILMPQLEHPGDARIVAEKLVHALGQPFRIDALELHIGASVGYCSAPAADVDLETLIQQADAQLYEAKRQGRNRASGIQLTR